LSSGTQSHTEIKLKTISPLRKNPRSLLIDRG
jgi:hypothetical protein